MDQEMSLYAGVDLGGTNLRVGLRRADSPELLDRLSLPVDPEWTPAALVEAVRSALEPLLERRARGSRLLGIGMGLTGDINPFAGTCHSMKRFPGLEGAPLAALLGTSLKVPATILNDGLTATLAELRVGAGREVADFLLITLGTGIGGGIVLGRRLLLGSAGRIGKVGHQIIQTEGPVHCHCGLRGCWQSLAGKEGVSVRARRIAAASPDSALAHLCRDGDVDLRRVAELAAGGDAASRSVVEETGRYVGIGVANLAKILAPERVVIGGGIAERNRVLMDAVHETVDAYAIKPYQRVPVAPAAAGKEAGVLGATFLAEGLERLR